MSRHYDCIVIGAGSGGLTVARGLARAHKKVLLIEKNEIGGDCTNVGCVPSKAALSFARKNHGCGLKAVLDFARGQREMIKGEESIEKLTVEGIECMRGAAVLKGGHIVKVDSKSYDAKKIVIATGSRPQRMEIPTARKQSVLTNEEFFEIDSNIKNLVIIGGGYIGCELAEVAALSGVAVTIIQKDSRLIPREEPESSQRIREHLESCGVVIHCSAQVQVVTESKVTITTPDAAHELLYDNILTALGRTPNVDSLGLSEAGVAVKRGIVTNAYCVTSQSHIFAIGDCVDGNPAFTHWANNEGRCVVRNIIFPWWKVSYRHEPLPTTLYTEVEIARVGPTEAEALAQYSKEDLMTACIHSDSNDRTVIAQKSPGFVKLLALRATGEVVGGTIALQGAGEMIPRIVQAVRTRESVQSLSSQVFPYPTQADMLKRAADQLFIERIRNQKMLFAAYVKAYGAQIFALLVWSTLLLSFVYVKSISGLTTLQILREVVLFVSNHPYGPFVYIACYALRPLLFIPATILTFSSGVLFGLWNGLLLTVIAETASAMVGYTMARFVAGSAVIQSRIGAQLKDFLSTDLTVNLLITRFAFFPFDIVNFICGALRISPFTFFWTTAVGIIPGAFVFILAGTSVDTAAFLNDFTVRVNTRPLLIAGVLLIVCLLGAKMLKQWKRI